MAIKWETDRNSSVKTIVQSNIDWIKEQRALGRKAKDIAAELGIHPDRLSRYSNPEAYERELRLGRERGKAKRGKERQTETRKYAKVHVDNVTRIEVLGELPPPDTRDLTARFFGDPVVGRRWIDRMKQQEDAKNKTV
jgi:AraC-like DNA-binding protein